MKPKPNKAKPINLLALAALITSPEYARWAVGVGPLPSLDSPQNLSRFLEFNADLLILAASTLVQAKASLRGMNWNEAKKRLADAFKDVGGVYSQRDELLRAVGAANAGSFVLKGVMRQEH